MAYVWVTAAAGASMDDLQATIGDMELKKGTKVKVIMDTWAGWAFDAWGAEQLFGGYVPDGMELVDVYQENGKGVVEMVADPAWLLPMVLFIGRHWLAIAIAGAVLTMIVSAVIVSIRIPEEAIPAVAGSLFMWAAIAVVGAVAVKQLVNRPTRAPPSRGRY